MATEGGIKQDIAAARSLLHYLEQGQAQWLARLANPLPPALSPDCAAAVQMLKALGSFDPMAGLAERLPQPEPAKSGEPLGIGARPRDSIRRPQDQRATAGSVVPLAPLRPKPKSPNTPMGPLKHQELQPNDAAKPKRIAAGPTEPKPNIDAIKQHPATQAHHKPTESKGESPKPAQHTGRKRHSGSNTQPRSKARQLAEARKALARKHQGEKTVLKQKRRKAAEAKPSEQASSVTAAAPSVTERKRPMLTLPGSPGGERTESTIAPPAAARESSAPVIPSPQAATRTASSLPTATQSHRSEAALPISEVIGDPQVALPGDPPPTTPPHPRDDIAQQLSDAARLHGIDLT